MKKVNKPNAYLMWHGHLYRVSGISDGRTIHMVAVDGEPCPTCKQVPEVSLLEHSPLFQDNAEAVDTLEAL